MFRGFQISVGQISEQFQHHSPPVIFTTSRFLGSLPQCRRILAAALRIVVIVVEIEFLHGDAHFCRFGGRSRWIRRFRDEVLEGVTFAFVLRHVHVTVPLPASRFDDDPSESQQLLPSRRIVVVVFIFIGVVHHKCPKDANVGPRSPIGITQCGHQFVQDIAGIFHYLPQRRPSFHDVVIVLIVDSFGGGGWRQ